MQPLAWHGGPALPNPVRTGAGSVYFQLRHLDLLNDRAQNAADVRASRRYLGFQFVLSWHQLQ
jgi:hypothetical protein